MSGTSTSGRDGKIAIIIGAGPAGLTAAYELLNKTDIKPIVLEKSPYLGGLSKTVEYRGNRIDIGGHRFFSKSKTVMDWWTNILPLQGAPAWDDIALNRFVPLSTSCSLRSIGSNELVPCRPPDPEIEDRVMLIRRRLSRIYFLNKFFDYPVSLNARLISGLGLTRTAGLGLSFLWSQMLPRRVEKSLEDYFINSFGKELYRTFFKDYTEKVWGIPCTEIKPEWGAQRTRGLSVYSALTHAIKSIFSRDTSLTQSSVHTSLINQFMYPKLGPGQMWEETGRQVVERGGEIRNSQEVVGIKGEGNNITQVSARDPRSGEATSYAGDYFFSTMPVKDLVEACRFSIPERIREVAEALPYRDFITVGLLVSKLRLRNETSIATINNIIPDNWLYIQEKGVKLGRVQVFNNWSPYMISDSTKVWLGLEYFCNEGDALWSKTDGDMIGFAAEELVRINFIDREDVLDGVVLREPKTYPVYGGSYEEFGIVRDFLDRFSNLFLIGRNGMHKYNNMDHSMLTAMTAVSNIIRRVDDKENIWEINTEEEYLEERKSDDGLA